MGACGHKGEPRHALGAGSPPLRPPAGHRPPGAGVPILSAPGVACPAVPAEEARLGEKHAGKNTLTREATCLFAANDVSAIGSHNGLLHPAQEPGLKPRLQNVPTGA